MKKNGFSRIELLIMIAVLGITAATLFFTLLAFMKNIDDAGLESSANYTITKVVDNMYWIEITSRSYYLSDEIAWMNTAFGELSKNVTCVMIIRTGSNARIEGAYVIVK